MNYKKNIVISLFGAAVISILPGYFGTKDYLDDGCGTEEINKIYSDPEPVFKFIHNITKPGEVFAKLLHSPAESGNCKELIRKLSKPCEVMVLEKRVTIRWIGGNTTEVVVDNHKVKNSSIMGYDYNSDRTIDLVVSPDSASKEELQVDYLGAILFREETCYK